MGIPAADPTSSSGVIPTEEIPPVSAGPEPDDEPERLRGVVSLPHRRAVLFADEVTLNTGSLPRWRPEIAIDERRLADDDDE